MSLPPYAQGAGGAGYYNPYSAQAAPSQAAQGGGAALPEAKSVAQTAGGAALYEQHAGASPSAPAMAVPYAPPAAAVPYGAGAPATSVPYGAGAPAMGAPAIATSAPASAVPYGAGGAAPASVSRGFGDADGGMPTATATVVPGSVMAAMAVPVSEAQIMSQWQQQGFDTSKLGALPVATAEEVLPAGQWYSPQELQVLAAQPLPPAIDYAAVMNAAPPPPSGPVPQQGVVVLEPAGGALPIMAGAYSAALIEADSSKSGIVSRDPVLNSRDELLRFFNMHGTQRPQMYVHVEGYHHEIRTRTVTSTDSNGNTTHRTESELEFFWVCV
jgi:hypothetical protein